MFRDGHRKISYLVDYYYDDNDRLSRVVRRRFFDDEDEPLEHGKYAMVFINPATQEIYQHQSFNRGQLGVPPPDVETLPELKRDPERTSKPDDPEP